MGDTNYEDVNMDSPGNSDTHSESTNSDSSFHRFSMSEDTEPTSVSSSENSPMVRLCARTAIGLETQRLSGMNHCVDPKLTSIDQTPFNEHITLGTWDWSDEEVTASDAMASQGVPVLSPTSQLPDL